MVVPEPQKEQSTLYYWRVIAYFPHRIPAFLKPRLIFPNSPVLESRKRVIPTDPVSPWHQLRRLVDETKVILAVDRVKKPLKTERAAFRWVLRVDDTQVSLINIHQSKCHCFVSRHVITNTVAPGETLERLMITNDTRLRPPILLDGHVTPAHHSVL